MEAKTKQQVIDWMKATEKRQQDWQQEVKKRWAAAAKKAHAAGEDKQVTVDDFAGAWATMDDDMLDAALAKFHKDWGGEGTAREIADELRSSRENSRTVETRFKN